MGFLIDTNILSELQKGGRADIGVKTWYDNCGPDDFFLSVLVVGEIRQGIERLRRRTPFKQNGWNNAFSPRTERT